MPLSIDTHYLVYTVHIRFHPICRLIIAHNVCLLQSTIAHAICSSHEGILSLSIWSSLSLIISVEKLFLSLQIFLAYCRHITVQNSAYLWPHFLFKDSPKTVFLGLIFQHVFQKKTINNLTLRKSDIYFYRLTKISQVITPSMNSQ